jgi:hypothetical protein
MFISASLILFSIIIIPINMLMEHNLFIFNTNIDKEFLLSEALMPEGYEPFIDPLSKTKFNDWSIKHMNSGYAKKIALYWADLLGSTLCKPRFYIQETGFSIPYHKDRGTLCSINYIISGHDNPISFRDETVIYQTALLNTQQDHAVISPSSKRVLFKVSVFDIPYNIALNKIKSTSIKYVLPP